MHEHSTIINFLWNTLISYGVLREIRWELQQKKTTKRYTNDRYCNYTPEFPQISSMNTYPLYSIYPPFLQNNFFSTGFYLTGCWGKAHEAASVIWHLDKFTRRTGGMLPPLCTNVCKFLQIHLCAYVCECAFICICVFKIGLTICLTARDGGSALRCTHTDTHAASAFGRQDAALLMFVFSMRFHSHKSAQEAWDPAETERFSLKTYRTQLCYQTRSFYLFPIISLVFFLLFSHLTSTALCFILCLFFRVFPLTSFCHHKTPSSDLSGCEPWAARDRRSWWIGNMSHNWVLETWQPSVFCWGFSHRAFKNIHTGFFFFVQKCKNTHRDTAEIHLSTMQRFNFQAEDVKWEDAE